MSQASLRNSNGDAYVYLEGATGSTAFGVDSTNNDQVNLITSDATSNLYPGSGGQSIAIQSTTPGNITFSPKGTGETIINNGDLVISGNSSSGANIDMLRTNTGGTQGVINLSGTRFLHNYGPIGNNVFLGEGAGNFGNTGGQNTIIGTSSLTNVTSGSGNTSVGTFASLQLTSGLLNTCVGSAALNALTTGRQNVAIGNISLNSITSGSNNISIGQGSGTSYSTSESSNIVIGNSGVISESNHIRIGTQGSGSGQQNACNIAGIYGSSVTAAGMVVVDTSGNLGSQALPTTAPILAWSVITSAPTSAVNNGYICNSAGTLTVTLPTVAAVGTLFGISGMNNATGWKLAQNAGQQIFLGTSATTSGATGFLSSTATYDSVTLVCNVANTSWIVIPAPQGNITVH